MDTVYEHMDSNWAPVLTEDGAAQEARAATPQEPFSDAYLSGMPSRKRRCVRESRPEPTLDGLVNGNYSWGYIIARTFSVGLLRQNSVLFRQRCYWPHYRPTGPQNATAPIETR